MFQSIALACGLAATFDPVPADPPSTEPSRDPESPAELLYAYRYYGLPLPPKGSYLAKWEGTVTHTIQPGNRKEITNEIHLALIRNEEDKRSFKDYVPVNPTVDLLKKNDGGSPPGNMTTNRWLYSSEWLIFTAQAYHLGWTDAAKHGWEIGEKGSDLRLDDSTTPILNFLKTSAWEFHREQIRKPNSDRRQILDRMTRCLCPHDSDFHEYQLQFHVDLKMSTRRNWNRRGTAEDLFDEIVRGRKTFDDLLALGFDAIPALIRHLDDTRFTRESATGGANNFLHMYSVRVNERCSELLDTLLEDASRYRRINPNNNFATIEYRCQADEANEWYRQIRHHGVRQWGVENVLKSYEMPYPENAHLNEPLLVILRENYPDDLAALIGKQKKRVVNGVKFLRAVVSSRLSREKKPNALREAERNPIAWHPLDIIRARRAIDPDEARIQFASRLERAIRTNDPNDVVVREHDLTVIDALHEFGDVALWKSFQSILPKIDMGTKHEMIHADFLHRDQFRNDEQKKEQFGCFLKLLDDRTALPAEVMEDYRRQTSNPITIGDVAMFKLARCVGVEIAQQPERSPAEWAAVREQVRLAAEKELAKK